MKVTHGNKSRHKVLVNSKFTGVNETTGSVSQVSSKHWDFSSFPVSDALTVRRNAVNDRNVTQMRRIFASCD